MIAMAKTNEIERVKPKTRNIRAMEDVADALLFVAARRGVPVSELIDPLLRQYAMTEQMVESKKLAEENRKRGG